MSVSLSIFNRARLVTCLIFMGNASRVHVSLKRAHGDLHADHNQTLKANDVELHPQRNWQISARSTFKPSKRCAMLLLAFNPVRGPIPSRLSSTTLGRGLRRGHHSPVASILPFPSLWTLADVADLPPATPEVMVQQTEMPQPTTSEGTRRPKRSFVTAAVESVGPAVVRIDTERFTARDNSDMVVIPGVEFERQQKYVGYGSGVIMNEDGQILTNAHVVKNAEKVTVTLTDGRRFEGTVTGTDDYMDLAAVKVPTEVKLPTAPLGKSKEVEVGDWAIAIGNAAGLDNTVTRGIVSSLSRSAAEIGIPNEKVNFIQTDAAINPGNSGGPLVNEFGEVIGINTVVRANANGIGFAIPIDTAESAMRVLSQGKKIPHSYIGVSMGSVTVEAAKQNNADPNADIVLPETPGAIILKIGTDTPAATAGLRRFDLIQEIDGRPMKNAADVQMTIDRAEVGQKLKCKLIRQKKVLNLVVTTADLNAPRQQSTN